MMNVPKNHSEQAKQSLIKEVRDLAKKLGKTPTSIEFELSGRAMYVFGSWNKFLIEAGLELNQTKTNFNGFKKQEILELISTELKRIGTTKSTDYIKFRSKGSPSYNTILKLLEIEGWNDILEMLDIEPNMKKSKRRKKTTKCKAQDCNSVVSGKGYCNKHYAQVKRHGYVKDQLTEKEKQIHINRMRSRKARVDNLTGIKGVNLLESGKYRARIINKGKEYHLGIFDNIDDAKQARIDGEVKYWGKIHTLD